MSVFSGNSGRNMSVFTSATMRSRGTVGCAAKNFDPSSPFSSPVTATNRIERAGFAFRSCSSVAASSIAATPDALSIAPL